jgi:DNA mismatch repair ATPase MutS
MDEVGRGTTPEDGIAVSYACLYHLYHINQSRTLFATHFHALTDMTKGFEKLGCYCNDVLEEPDSKFSYVHRLRKGVNRESHALKVARVAGESNHKAFSSVLTCIGLPEDAIDIAAEVLKELKRSISTKRHNGLHTKATTP